MTNVTDASCIAGLAEAPDICRVNPVARALWEACLLELCALKPGNVGVHGDGHGMRVAQFVASARVIAPLLAGAGRGLGGRIAAAVSATAQAVECNTNLGIVLLCAPLAQAALSQPAQGNLRPALVAVIANAGVEDTARVFEAIRLASPGGLGEAERHDVAARPVAGLREVMASAAHRDRIAFQYASGFEDVFEIGLPALERLHACWSSEAWAAVGVYLTFLSRFPDTHISRKLGASLAERVRAEATEVAHGMLALAAPTAYRQRLLDFDAKLKARGINPGTSADLTVATLLAKRLVELETPG